MSSNLTNAIVGWDIGGAHLKAVLLNNKGEVLQVLQIQCELWKGLDKLKAAMQNALQAFKIEPHDTKHVVTMTGELVDLFANRHEGVIAIASSATTLLGKRTLFYAANTGFVPLQRVAALSDNIASTNWHASASALAIHVASALFVDVGSTTTDIITIEAGKVICGGLTDAERLQADSLVYTGVVRTPVMALTQKLPFEAGISNVAAEFFANMADVYRLTGELVKDDADTADGKGKTPLESARRLARMIGHDVDVSQENKKMAKWIKLAFSCRNVQMQQIKTAMQKQLKPNMTIIGAGAGSFLVKQMANDLNYNFKHACELVSMRSADLPLHGLIKAHIDKYDIDLCFPAYAVASLALMQSIC
jgi:(4-(4-[2-(gamma-L-glutamylamino)ethyl]phenoxymethyl)furan-2-yl)methanamine synthase